MIGIKKEVQELNDLYESGGAEVVAMYDRRRSGKAVLVEETVPGRFTLRQPARSPGATDLGCTILT